MPAIKVEPRHGAVTDGSVPVKKTSMSKTIIFLGVVVLLGVIAAVYFVGFSDNTSGSDTYEYTEGDVSFQAAIVSTEFGDSSVEGVPLSKTLDVMVSEESTTTSQSRSAHNRVKTHPKRQAASVVDGNVRRNAVRRAFHLEAYSDEGSDYNNHEAWFSLSNPQQQSTELFDYMLCLFDQLNLDECPMLNNPDGYIAKLDRALCETMAGESSSDNVEVEFTDAVVIAARADENSPVLAWGWTNCQMGWGDYECRFELEITEPPSESNYFGVATMSYAVVDYDTIIGKAYVEFGLQEDTWNANQFGARASTSLMYDYEWQYCFSDTSWFAWWYTYDYYDFYADCPTNGYMYTRTDAVSVVIDSDTLDLEFQLLSNSSDHSYWGDDEYSYGYFDLSQGVSDGDMVSVRHGYAYVDEWCEGSFEDIQSVSKADLQAMKANNKVSSPAAHSTQHRSPSTGSSAGVAQAKSAHKNRRQAHSERTAFHGHSNRALQHQNRHFKNLKKKADLAGKISLQAEKQIQAMQEKLETQAQAQDRAEMPKRRSLLEETYECSAQTVFYPAWGICPVDETECTVFCEQEDPSSTATFLGLQTWTWEIVNSCSCSSGDTEVSICEGSDYIWDYNMDFSGASWWDSNWNAPTTEEECTELCGFSDQGGVASWSADDTCGDYICSCDDIPQSLFTDGEYFGDDVCQPLNTQELCDEWCGSSSYFDDYDWSDYNEHLCSCDSSCYAEKYCYYSDAVYYYNAWWETQSECPRVEAGDQSCEEFCAGVEVTDTVTQTWTNEDWGWGSSEDTCRCFIEDQQVDQCSTWNWCPPSETDCYYDCDSQGYNHSFEYVDNGDYETKNCSCQDPNDNMRTVDSCSYDDYNSYDWCQDVAVECYNRNNPVSHVYDYIMFNFEDGSSLDLLTEFSFTYEVEDSSWPVWGYYSQWGAWWDTWMDEAGPEGKLITLDEWSPSPGLQLIPSILIGQLISYDTETWTRTTIGGGYFDGDTQNFYCDRNCLRPGLVEDDLYSCESYDDTSSVLFDTWDESVLYTLDTTTMTWYYDGQEVIYPGNPNTWDYTCWVSSMSLITETDYLDQQNWCPNSISAYYYMEWATTTFTFLEADGATPWYPDEPIIMQPYTHTLENDRNQLATHVGATVDFVASSPYYTEHNIDWEEETGTHNWYPAFSLVDGIQLEDVDGNKYVLKANYLEKTFRKKLCTEEQMGVMDKEDWLLPYPDASWDALDLPLNADASREALPKYSQLEELVEAGVTLKRCVRDDTTDSTL